jgi:hypothetical protein
MKELGKETQKRSSGAAASVSWLSVAPALHAHRVCLSSINTRTLLLQFPKPGGTRSSRKQPKT